LALSLRAFYFWPMFLSTRKPQIVFVIYVYQSAQPMSDYRTKPIPGTKSEPAYVERPWGSFQQYAHNQG
jgi:hypothetical protein